LLAANCCCGGASNFLWLCASIQKHHQSTRAASLAKVASKKIEMPFQFHCTRRENRTLVYFIYLLHIRPACNCNYTLCEITNETRDLCEFFLHAIYRKSAVSVQALLFSCCRVTSLAARLNNEFQRDMNAAHTVLSTLYYIPC
jgi:hypothetical protein